MADNTDLREGRENLPYFDNQLDKVTKTDGTGGYVLKTDAVIASPTINVTVSKGSGYEIAEEPYTGTGTITIRGFLIGITDGVFNMQPFSIFNVPDITQTEAANLKAGQVFNGISAELVANLNSCHVTWETIKTHESLGARIINILGGSAGTILYLRTV